MLSDLDYNPNTLLDAIKNQLCLRSDAALSRAINVAPPVLSKVRHHQLPIGASLLVRLSEVSELPIKDLRALMGDKRPRFEPIVI